MVCANFAHTNQHGAIKGKSQTVEALFYNLIDNYIDETVLLLLSKRLQNVVATIYTKQISSQLQLDLIRHNAQYESISIYELTHFHDRFLIIDEIVYHIGASLKDLGKKLFAFSKMGIGAAVLL
jgi:hypothetical protein